LFFIVGRPARGIAEAPYDAGYPTKIVLRTVRQRLARRVVLRGFRCSDRHILRFAYRDELLPPPPLTPAQLDSLGTASARLDPYKYPMRKGQRTDYGGYMLFSSEGQWMITVLERGRVVGSIVLLARQIN